MNEPTICIHGLGYIGLPTALMFAAHDYETRGYDTDPDVRETLATGTVPYDEPELDRYLAQGLNSGQFKIVDEVAPADCHIICVPTPYQEEEQKTDLRYVESAAETVRSVLRKNDTVVLESTVPPGTTSNVLRPILEGRELTAGESFTLAYSPETVLPGKIMTELRENDRIVGNISDGPAAEVVALYESFVEGTIRTTDATTAEFVKLIQNAFRDTNIAFANETAKLAHEFGIDSREAIELANKHPRVDILSPGPGVGGHCLPIDPLFLRRDNHATTLIEAAREVNDGMAAFVVELLNSVLGTVEDHRIAIFGVAYKGGVDDTRHSPSLALVERLTDYKNADTAVHDPVVKSARIPLVTQKEAVTDADALVVVTDHPQFERLEPEPIGEKMAQRVLIDTRAILDRKRWQDAGFEVRRI